MIYPDQYKCLICKKRYYGCKRKPQQFMLSCSDFVARVLSVRSYPRSLALFRCLTNNCPRVWRQV